LTTHAVKVWEVRRLGKCTRGSGLFAVRFAIILAVDTDIGDLLLATMGDGTVHAPATASLKNFAS
jgi:hypothetical protein